MSVDVGGKEMFCVTVRVTINPPTSVAFLQSIQIKILLGHSAQWRKKPTPEGFTHDWKMVVQGEEGQEIRHFVEKVVFHLHESFPRPKRGTTCIICT